MMEKPGPDPTPSGDTILGHLFMREDPCEPTTAPELGEELNVERRTVLNRLDELEADGELKSKKVGGRSRVFWIPHAARRQRDRGGPPTEATGGEPAGGEEPTTDSTADTAAGGDTVEAATVDDVEFPQGVDREAGLEAVDAAREYLREHGPASMRQIVNDVMPEHPLGYEVPELEAGDRYRGAWWRRVVKPGLEAVDDVEAPGPGRSDWRYVGE